MPNNYTVSTSTKLGFDLILYSSPDGNTKVSVYYEDETFWLTQKRLADLLTGIYKVLTFHSEWKRLFDTLDLSESRYSCHDREHKLHHDYEDDVVS